MCMHLLVFVRYNGRADPGRHRRHVRLLIERQGTACEQERPRFRRLRAAMRLD